MFRFEDPIYLWLLVLIPVLVGTHPLHLLQKSEETVA